MRYRSCVREKERESDEAKDKDKCINKRENRIANEGREIKDREKEINRKRKKVIQVIGDGEQTETG